MKKIESLVDVLISDEALIDKHELHLDAVFSMLCLNKTE